MAKQKHPLISIIIQTRQTPLMILKRSIQSIREQTYKNIEILLLDSNDTDSPYKEAMLAEAEFFTDIIHLEIPETKEFVKGKNEALHACHGDYITFVSAQDIMQPQRIEKIMMVFRKKKSWQAIYTNASVQQNNILENSDYNLLSTDFAYLSQLVFHCDCIQMVGLFDTELVAHCDDEFWFRFQSLKLTHHLPTDEAVLFVCPDDYHRYTLLESAIGYRQLYVKYISLFKKNKKAKKILYRKIAEEYKKAGVFHRYLQFLCKEFFIR